MSCRAASHRAIGDRVAGTVDDKAGKCGFDAVNMDILHLVPISSEEKLDVVPVSDSGT